MCTELYCLQLIDNDLTGSERVHVQAQRRTPLLLQIATVASTAHLTLTCTSTHPCMSHCSSPLRKSIPNGVHLQSVELTDSNADVDTELARCKADLLQCESALARCQSEVAVTTARAQQLELENRRLTANAGKHSHITVAAAVVAVACSSSSST
jgi:hypothetical protein